MTSWGRHATQPAKANDAMATSRPVQANTALSIFTPSQKIIRRRSTLRLDESDYHIGKRTRLPPRDVRLMRIHIAVPSVECGRGTSVQPRQGRITDFGQLRRRYTVYPLRGRPIHAASNPSRYTRAYLGGGRQVMGRVRALRASARHDTASREFVCALQSRGLA